MFRANLFARKTIFHGKMKRKKIIGRLGQVLTISKNKLRSGWREFQRDAQQ